MYSDQPIKFIGDDAFERAKFAKHIASFLCLPPDSPSITIGIEGPWGFGKTSCLNLIKDHLKKENNPIIVEFNPWLIGSLDSVIEGFIVKFATSIINKESKSDIAGKAAIKLVNFAKFLSPIKLVPGVEPWGTMVEKTLEGVGKSLKATVDMANFDLSARKKGVQSALNEINCPIVVIIDEIDRLPPEEVRIIFQVVKAICDFEGVSYLLAYEPEPVHNALSYGGVYDGKRYLEKIVQASYSLPRIGYLSLKNYLLKQVKSVLNDQSIELDREQEEIFKNCITQTGIVRSISTPRDVLRLANKIRISAKNTEGEVCFADLLLFEALELKFSKIVNAIKSEPQRFTENSALDEEYIPGDIDLSPDEITKDDKTKTFINELTEGLSPKDKKNIVSILEFLFPTVFDIYIPFNLKKSVVLNRICTSEALKKLLYGGLTSYAYSSNTAIAFLTSKQDREQILEDLDETGEIFGWLGYLELFLGEIKVPDTVSLYDLLLNILEKKSTQEKYQFAEKIADFLISLIKSLPKKKDQVNLLNIICSNETSLSLSHDVLLNFSQECGTWSNGKYYDPSKEAKVTFASNSLFKPIEMVHAKNLWLKTVRDAARHKEDMIDKESKPRSIFFRWGQLNDNDYTEVKDFIWNFIGNEEGLEKFIFLFSSSGGALNGIERLIANKAEFVKKIESNDQFPETTEGIIGYLKNLDKKKEEE